MKRFFVSLFVLSVIAGSALSSASAAEFGRMAFVHHRSPSTMHHAN